MTPADPGEPLPPLPSIREAVPQIYTLPDVSVRLAFKAPQVLLLNVFAVIVGANTIALPERVIFPLEVYTPAFDIVTTAAPVLPNKLSIFVLFNLFLTVTILFDEAVVVVPMPTVDEAISSFDIVVLPSEIARRRLVDVAPPV